MRAIHVLATLVLMTGCYVAPAGSEDDLDDRSGDSVEKTKPVIEERPDDEEDEAGNKTPSTGEEPLSDPRPDAGVTSEGDPACRFRYVGYGRAGEGERDFERKSTKMCFLERRGTALRFHSDTARNCKGDSGGPLFIDGTLTVVGTMARMTTGCSLTSPGTSSYVELAKMRDFIDPILNGL